VRGSGHTPTLLPAGKALKDDNGRSPWTMSTGEACLRSRPTLVERDFLLIRRAARHHRGEWALPGGFVGTEESLDDAA
jgi:ADP-ribose pyrophosphatase YjhB (NUDIX family)